MIEKDMVVVLSTDWAAFAALYGGEPAPGTAPCNMIADIAAYVTHARTPLLPTLATQLLTQLCRVASADGVKSMFAALGSRTKALQATFLNQLQAVRTVWPGASSGHGQCLTAPPDGGAEIVDAPARGHL
jgi:hypothetical protein